MDRIENLEIRFTGKIIIPDELSKVAITNLSLSGEIEEEGIERLKQMFQNCSLIINRERIHTKKYEEELLKYEK